MTGLRLAAFVAAVVLRHRGPRAALPVVGLLVAVALFGIGPARPPALVEAALLAFALSGLHVLLLWPVWPPVASEAAETAAFFGLPVVGWGAFVLRGGPASELFVVLAATVAVLAIVSAGGAQAAGEAGWRRPAHWALAVVVSAGAGAGTTALAGALAPRQRPLAGAAALGVALLAFAPAFLLEGRRVLRELGEESRLGLLPAEDVAVLARPWDRVREPRFGRPDERRTYVKSALLLAVALQQQRRRSGESVRLRQLEVLAFRTRVRRTLEARAARATLTDELTLPA